ncbi:MAG: LutB/LldF family L-lactate oxidation iron-sulfur protein, partial [Rhodospirillales bacterium]|nr:LutB/LldF family L-lactate oxidation iron-sulfur protein [Rhodospirillales bacterium]
VDDNARRALADNKLQAALARLATGFPVKRVEARDRLPEFDALCDAARDLKNHVLANLDTYLEQYETRVLESGGRVHWARDAKEAREIILGICRDAGAKTVTKGKSMITEEIGVNEYLEENGVRPVETDLGEYIIQLRREAPSHLIAPAIHLSKDQIADSFRHSHGQLDAARPLEEPRKLLEEARAILRREFLTADVGITGANMLIAETGSSVIVTNEGNGDLTQTLAKTHIAVASIEKVVPTLEDAATILRVLARSATGQDITVYTTFSTGPKRAEDTDGPENYHVVLLDNGRSEMLRGPFREMLRCIRCAACLNSCPVYKSIGGHAYGWVYSGPMGSVLMPNLLGLGETLALPNASTLCGKCEDVCPMRIPLPRLLRTLRDRQFAAGKGGWVGRLALKSWARLARWPALYHFIMGIGVAAAARLGRNQGRFKHLPIMGGWTGARDLPAPEARTFMSQWRRRNK